MKREDIKSITLIGLVILSFVFTSELWFGLTSLRFNRSEAIEAPVDEGLRVIEVVSPSKLLIHSNNSTKLFTPGSESFSKGWQIGREILGTLFESNNFDGLNNIDIEKWEKAKEDSLELVFRNNYSLEFWSKAFNTINDNVPEINLSRLLISANTGKLYIYDNFQKKYFETNYDSRRLAGRLISEIELEDYIKVKTISEIESYPFYFANNVYTPIDLNSLEFSEISLRREEINPDRLAQNFFSDMSIVRKIMERDGATIYTDGRKGLRIYENGAIEFNYALPSKEEPTDDELYEALKIATEFVNLHGGLPRNVFISDIKHSNREGEGFKIYFSLYNNGIPIVGEPSMIEVTVFDGKVKNYFRDIQRSTGEEVEEGKKGSIIPPLKALEAAASNLRFLIDANEEGQKIDSLYFAYFKDNDIAKPAWVVEIKGMKTFVNALNGEILRSID